MADLERIKREIADIAGRPNSVRFSEITWVADQLKQLGYSVDYSKRTHTWLFQIQQEIFGICDHNRGKAQIKATYVKTFVNAMTNLGLYGDEHGTE